ncbi:hypothetical protein PMAYCL1PPCAC_20389, partial [Pristionchus mayeri]
MSRRRQSIKCTRIMNGDVKLRAFLCDTLKRDTCISFLSLIGFTFRDGKFYSNRRNIEIFERNQFDHFCGVYIFDGPLEVIVRNCAPERIFGRFCCQIHPSRESLEGRK